MRFDHLYVCLDAGETLDEAFRHGGDYEKELIDFWESWPGGFRLMGEKDDFTEADNDNCVFFYQKLSEIM